MEVMPGYKQTEVGVIPKDWELATLGTLTSEIGDGIHATPLYSPHGEYFFINGNNIRDGRIVVTKDTKTVDYSEFKKHRKNLGDRTILLSINGTIGNLGLYAGEAVLLGKSAAYLNIRGEVGKLFVYYYLQTGTVRRQFNDGLTGTTINNLGLATIRATLIAVPPTKAEQEAIAEVLSKADALIETLERLIAKKRLLKKGVMQRVLRPKDGWIVKALGENCEVITKGTTPTSIGRDFISSGINFLKAESISESGEPIPGKMAFIDEFTHKLLKRSQLMEGDILISIAGVLGRVGLVERNVLPANTNQALAIIRLSKESEFERSYLFYYLRSSMIQKQIRDINVQAAQANISLQNVREFQINFPSSRDEQTAIAAILSAIDTEIALLEAQLAKYRQLKQGLMQKLLTGRIRLI